MNKYLEFDSLDKFMNINEMRYAIIARKLSCEMLHMKSIIRIYARFISLLYVFVLKGDLLCLY